MSKRHTDPVTHAADAARFAAIRWEAFGGKYPKLINQYIDLRMNGISGEFALVCVFGTASALGCQRAVSLEANLSYLRLFAQKFDKLDMAQMLGDRA